jgi:hypothetical protein
MKLSLVFCLAMAIASAASGAAAQQQEPPKTPTPESAPPDRVWYGWQLLGPDAAAVALLAAGLTVSDGSFHVCDACDADHYVNPHTLLQASGVLVYLGGGLLVHLAHHQRRKGLYSFALRAAAPTGGALVGATIGAVVGASQSNPCIGNPRCPGPGYTDYGLVGMAIGAGLGLVAAPIIDSSVLAYEDRPVESKPASVAGGWQIVPVPALPRDVAGRMTPTLELAGVF